MVKKKPIADCGLRPECRWVAEVFNKGGEDEHVCITCYSPDGPAEVCRMNPDLPTKEAMRIARRLVYEMKMTRLHQ